MARIKCRACGKLTDEGVFCNECGAPQDGPATGAPPFQPHEQAAYDEPAAPGVERGRGATADPWTGAADDVSEAFTCATPASPPRRVTVINPYEQLERPSSADGFPRVTPPRQPEADCSDDSDECPYLRIECDRITFCLEGIHGLLRVRVAILSEGLEDVRLDLRLDKMNGKIQQTERWLKPAFGKNREFRFNIPPLAQGPHAVEICLQFKKDQMVWKYEASPELYVHPGDSAKQIAQSIVVNINNDIKTGAASDVHLSQNMADELNKIARNGSSHAVSELLSIMNSDRRAYRREKLYETGCVPPPPKGHELDAPPGEGVATRVTLSAGGRLAHLISGRRITLGRHRENGITTRLFSQAGDYGERISKYHCTVEHDGHALTIQDGVCDLSGQTKPSTWGVFWQGQSVRGSLRVPFDAFPRGAKLGLAGSPSAYDFGLTADGYYFGASECETCSGRGEHSCRRGRVPAVVLRRTDNVPECYALLWACLDLGEVLPGCSGVIVCHEQGAFSWRKGDASGWLTPGKPLAVGGRAIEVKAFCQYGL